MYINNIMSNRRQETPLQRLIRIRRTRDDLLDPREGNSGVRNLNYMTTRGENHYRAKDLGMTQEEYEEYLKDNNKNQSGRGQSSSKVPEYTDDTRYIKDKLKKIINDLKRSRPSNYSGDFIGSNDDYKEIMELIRNTYGNSIPALDRIILLANEKYNKYDNRVYEPLVYSKFMRDVADIRDSRDEPPEYTYTTGSGIKKIPLHQPRIMRGGKDRVSEPPPVPIVIIPQPVTVGRGTGRSFLHDAAHGIFKVLPVITALATVINKLGISAKPEEWVAKATDYLKGNETQRQYIQEDIDTAQPNDYSWKELYAFKKAGYTLPERLNEQLAKEMDEDTRKYEYLQANPIQITAEQQQTQQYKTASQLFIDKYAKELNKFLALSNADFNAQKNNIRLREINIKNSNYLYKSPVLDDLLSKINVRLGQVGAGKRTDSLRRILNTKLTPKYLRQFTKDEILEKLYEAQSLFDYFSKKTHKINQAQYLQLQNIMRILEDVYYRLP